MVTVVRTVGCGGMLLRSLCQFQQMDIIHTDMGSLLESDFRKSGTPCKTEKVTGTSVDVVSQADGVRSGRRATVIALSEEAVS